MIFLPLVDRELRGRARRPATFRARFGAAAVAITLAILMLLASEAFLLPGNVGQFLFYALGITAFVFCLLEGVRTTADSLSEEKRSGTLGLLFLTDLRGYDVVLGKLMATSLNSVYCLLAIFPALAIPIVLGGTTGGEFWRLALMLANTLFFSLSAGLFVSSISFHDRKAGTATVILVGGLTLLPPLVPALLGGGRLFGFTISPLHAFLALPDGRYTTNPNLYWNAMLGIHLASWGFVALAIFLLPRQWQPAATPPRRPSRPPRGARTEGEPRAEPVASRRQLLDVHPILWLAHRGMGTSGPIWLLLLACGALCLFLNVSYAQPTGLFGIALALHFLLAAWAASDAAQALSGSRDSGALELLLAAPLDIDEIIRGYQQALHRKFFQPVLVLAIVEAVVLVAHAAIMGMEHEDPLAGLLVFGFVGFTLGVSILDILAVSRFGLWMGMIHKSSIRATVKTVVYVLLLPMVLSVFSLCCGVLWPIVGLVKNVLFISISQDRLRRDFRRVVSEQYSGGGIGIDAEPPRAGPGQRRPERTLPSVWPPPPPR